MRLKEFLTEQQLSDVHDALDVVSLSLPYTYRINQLFNNDFYPIYRFGVAIAAVRAEDAKDGVTNKFKPEFKSETSWGGENEVVTSFDPDIGNIVDRALKKIGKSGKTLVSSKGSEEMKDTNKGSPLKPFRGYKR